MILSPETRPVPSGPLLIPAPPPGTTTASISVLTERLMEGYWNSLFEPNDNLSRAQLCQIVYNLEGPRSDRRQQRYRCGGQRMVL